MHDTLYIIIPIFNPWRYKSRIKLYNDFKKYAEDCGAKVITVELAHANRDFELNSEVKLRAKSELWHKERMINLGIQRLPEDWQYVAWIDPDIIFARPDWVSETIQYLQHYSFVQLFSHAVDLGPKYEPLKTHEGIIYSYDNGKLVDASGKYDKFHPGFAWAATRDAITNVGGLFDVGILGSGDRHMAMSLLEVPHSIPKNLSKGYIERLELWGNLSKKHIKKNVGHLPGVILHQFHGSKVNRRYQDRWKILVNNAFDPEFDIKFDWQGLYSFTGNKPQLEADIRNYFRLRDEDSTSI